MCKWGQVQGRQGSLPTQLQINAGQNERLFVRPRVDAASTARFHTEQCVFGKQVDILKHHSRAGGGINRVWPRTVMAPHGNIGVFAITKRVLREIIAWFDTFHFLCTRAEVVRLAMMQVEGLHLHRGHMRHQICVGAWLATAFHPCAGSQK